MHSDNQTPPEPAPPGLGRRFGAILYDTLQVIAVLMLVTLPLAFLELGQTAVHQSILVLTIFAFFAKFWRHGGQTLGMKCWDIRIVSSNGQAITFTQCLLRIIAATASLLTLGLGYFWMLIDKEKLTWPDRFSETQLIMTPKRDKIFNKKKA
ncbi:MAG: RDD family protein [Gammaproteobacteria bacterium]|jgi:uncharacterized RDD family membrane protein YckC|nr:RDD family protein [Gammaproteobacteria bacterium]